MCMVLMHTHQYAIITIWILVHLSTCTIGNMEDLIAAVGPRSWDFRSMLNRNTVTTDPKKAVDPNLEFFDTVQRTHFCQCMQDSGCYKAQQQATVASRHLP